MWHIRDKGEEREGRVGGAETSKRQREEKKEKRGLLVILALSPCYISTGNMCVCEGRDGGWD